MTARFFAFYTAAVLLVPVGLLSLISVAPGGRLTIVAVQCAFGAGALLFACLGYYLGRVPAGHWANRVSLVRWVFFLAGLAATIVVLRGVIV